jgi:hypothetical protein
MSAEITKVYKQDMGSKRFIGKKYSSGPEAWADFDKDENWNLLEMLKNKNPTETITLDELNSTIGLISEESGSFEYWLGIFAPFDTVVPEGFQYLDFPKGEICVCWVYGSQDEYFGQEGACGERLEKEGYKVYTDLCFERYYSPRSETPDEKGNYILDIGFFINR